MDSSMSGAGGSLQANGGRASAGINFDVGFHGLISWREII
jgi:hypothetical protein